MGSRTYKMHLRVPVRQNYQAQKFSQLYKRLNLILVPVIILKTFFCGDYEYTKGRTTKVGVKNMEMTFLRQNDNSKRISVFPIISDEDTIMKDQIAKLLPALKEEKGNNLYHEDVL
ncbi:hypothetical protein L9F63_016902 [Diploptera punctata]|uniref:Uncharacterized protein n=1 Tax=Diploptera punctata TaxID=6984 RepID=A0AAD7ZZX7_DIPPU|nr:hypothetical protein L9F63_016902 [Diploptera punctata]